MIRQKAYSKGHFTTGDFELSRGFTFIELLFAVLILAAAILPIYGLQTTALDRVARNENELQATLIARQLLSFVEGSEGNLRSTNTELRADDALRQIAKGTKGLDYQPANVDVLRQYSVIFAVEPWTIQVTEQLPIPLQRLRLEVSWGPTSRDRVKFMYLFSPPPEK
jgi:prepilin-type N-terminal cleavage/methylation domain-containing protein